MKKLKIKVNNMGDDAIKNITNIFKLYMKSRRKLMKKTSKVDKPNNNTINILDKFNTFIKQRQVYGKGTYHTHCMFGKPYGKFDIDDEDYEEFMDLYCDVLLNVKGIELYMIERPKEVGPLLIDIDFKFSEEYPDRQYTLDHIKRLARKINKLLNTYYECYPSTLKSYIFEKEHPSECKNGKYKDGFHIVYPNIAMTAKMRYYIIEETRKKINTSNTFDDIPFENKLDDVFDICVVESNGWVMYGSKKMNGQYYQLTNILNHNGREEELEIDDDELVRLVSNRKYEDGHQGTPLKDDIDNNNLNVSILETLNRLGKAKPKKPMKKQKKRLNPISDSSIDDSIDDDSNESESVDEETELSDTNEEDYKPNYLRRIDKEHQRQIDAKMAKRLARILSKERATNYKTWIAVGWALHNVSKKLLHSWLRFSKKCPEAYDEEKCIEVWNNARDEGYTIASLYKWAQEDNIEGYKNIIRASVDSLMEEAETGTERHIAKVVHKLYEHEFKCTSLKHNEWFHYQEHRWVSVENGHTLDYILSEHLTEEFGKIHNKYIMIMARSNGIDRDNYMKKADNVMKIIHKLNKPGFKDGIMKECAKLFYDKKFTEKLDSKIHLIGFDNGVYDLNEARFRKGSPDDYMTFTVGYDYPEYYTKDHEDVKWVEDFFDKIQIKKDMNQYIKLLLSSYLDGSTSNETFIIWTGIGCHAKGTKIMMYDGTLKNVEDIEVGEQLMGDDSTPRTVKELFRGQDKMYRVTPKKGQSYVVNKDHRLALKYIGYSTISWDKRGNSWRYIWNEFNDKDGFRVRQRSFKVNNIDKKQQVYKIALEFKIDNEKYNEYFLSRGHKITIKVKDYFKVPKSIRRLFLGYRCPVSFPEKKVEVDPYILGYWLGDGNSADTGITTDDQEVVDTIEEMLKDYNLKLVNYKGKYKYGSTSTFFSGNETGHL
jgi:hypothetical protein